MKDLVRSIFKRVRSFALHSAAVAIGTCVLLLSVSFKSANAYADIGCSTGVSCAIAEASTADPAIVNDDRPVHDRGHVQEADFDLDDDEDGDSQDPSAQLVAWAHSRRRAGVNFDPVVISFPVRLLGGPITPPPRQ